MSTVPTTTPNFGIDVPPFDKKFFQEEYYNFLFGFDSLLAEYIRVINLKGLWNNSTSVVVGDKYIDATDGTIWEVAVAHSTAGTPTTFSTDRTNNPTYWTSVTGTTLAKLRHLAFSPTTPTTDAAVANETITGSVAIGDGALVQGNDAVFIGSNNTLSGVSNVDGINNNVVFIGSGNTYTSTASSAVSHVAILTDTDLTVGTSIESSVIVSAAASPDIAECVRSVVVLGNGDMYSSGYVSDSIVLQAGGITSTEFNVDKCVVVNSNLTSGSVANESIIIGGLSTYVSGYYNILLTSTTPTPSITGDSNIVIGSDATITGDNNVVIGNDSSIVDFSGTGATAIGVGRYTSTAGNASTFLGEGGWCDLYNTVIHGSIEFGLTANNKVAQALQCIATCTTTDATANVEMFLDGASGTQRITIPSNVACTFEIQVIGAQVGGAERCAYLLSGAIDNSGGTTALLGSVAKTVIHESTASLDCDAVADNTNDSLKLQVTGLLATTMRWVATVKLTQVGYAA